MYIPRINSGLKSEVLCLHKLHHQPNISATYRKIILVTKQDCFVMEISL